MTNKAREAYVTRCKLARVPHEYWFNKRWRTLQPENLRSTTPDARGQYISFSEKQQREWFTRFAADVTLLTKPYFLVFLGDHSAENAKRAVFGLLCQALYHELKGRAFTASQLRVSGAHEEPEEPLRLNIAVVHGFHTDDLPERRQAVRDFLQAQSHLCRLLIIHGSDAFRFMLDKVSLDPNAVFYFPSEGARFRLKTEQI